MSNDFQAEEPKAPRESIYDRHNPRAALWRSQRRPLDPAGLTPKRERKARSVGDRLAAFPFVYETRVEKSARVNVGTYAHGKLKGAICDVRLTSGDRVFDTVRYMRGRHPSESVEHYEARRGR